MNIHNFINRPMTTDLVSRLILSKTHNQEIYLSICGSYVVQIHNKTIPTNSQILQYPVNTMRKKHEFSFLLSTVLLDRIWFYNYNKLGDNCVLISTLVNF